MGLDTFMSSRIALICVPAPTNAVDLPLNITFPTILLPRCSAATRQLSSNTGDPPDPDPVSQKYSRSSPVLDATLLFRTAITFGPP